MIPMESCYDCGSEEIMCDVERWQVVCTNCTASVSLPDERLTKDEMIKIWNDGQRAKEDAND